MAVDLNPTGRRLLRQRARKMWGSVRTKQDWDALTAAQRSEIIRRFMKHVLAKEFRDFDANG